MRLYIFIAIVSYVLSAGACGDGTESSQQSELGEACSGSSDCTTGLCIEELGTEGADDPITFEDGYCSTQGCTFADDGSDDCLDGACLYYDYNWWDDIPSVGYCFRDGCETDRDCREDYLCEDFSTLTVQSKICIPVDALDGSASKVSQEKVTTSLYKPAIEAKQ